MSEERESSVAKRSVAIRWMVAGFAVVVIAIFFGLPALLDSRVPHEYFGSPFYDARPAAEFALTDQDGEVATLEGLRGKNVFFYFGFTNCPNICPVGLAHLAALYRKLSPTEQAVTQIVFVSVDPEKDTPEILKDYVAFFDPSFIGLTGSNEAIAEIAKGFGVFYEQHELDNDSGDYTVDHSSTVFLLDSEGRLRETFRHDQLGESDEIIEDLRHVMQTEPTT